MSRLSSKSKAAAPVPVINHCSTVFSESDETEWSNSNTSLNIGSNIQDDPKESTPESKKNTKGKILFGYFS